MICKCLYIHKYDLCEKVIECLIEFQAQLELKGAKSEVDKHNKNEANIANNNSTHCHKAVTVLFKLTNFLEQYHAMRRY